MCPALLDRGNLPAEESPTVWATSFLGAYFYKIITSRDRVAFRTHQSTRQQTRRSPCGHAPLGGVEAGHWAYGNPGWLREMLPLGGQYSDAQYLAWAGQS